MKLASRRVVFDGSGGVVLRGDAYGDDAAPPVLLLHGGGQTRHAWKNTARHLAAAGYLAVTLDLRGHGDSDWAADGDYGLDAFAEDLRLVAATFGSARPAVVGASMGGMTALVAEAESAEQVTSAIVLVDVVPRMEDEGVARVVEFMTAAPDGFASLDEAAEHVARYLPYRPRPRDVSGLARNLRTRRDGRLSWHWDPAFIEGRSDGSRPTDRLVAAARALTVPVLLVRGSMSDVVSEEGVADFLDLVPHARFADVKGAGHMVAGDRNDAFTDAVLGFLRDTVPGGVTARGAAWSTEAN